MTTNKMLIVWVAVVIASTLFITYKMMPGFRLFPKVNMVFIKQNGSLQSVTDARNPDFQVNLPVSCIHFPLDNELKHKDYGRFGYKNDFFMDLDCKMIVKKEGVYNFGIASDDGFQLYIDGQLRSEFLSNRQFSTNLVSLFLGQGSHTFSLKYYQGFGQLGLAAFYAPLESGRFRYIGQNSSLIHFKR